MLHTPGNGSSSGNGSSGGGNSNGSAADDQIPTAYFMSTSHGDPIQMALEEKF